MLRMIDEGNKAFEASISEAIKVASQLLEAIAQLESTLTSEKAKFAAKADLDQDWLGQIQDMAGQILISIATFQSVRDDFRTLSELSQELPEMNAFETAYFYVGNMFPGMRSISAAMEGRDPWTLERLSTFDRILSGITGLIDIATVVMTAGRAFNFFTAPCRAGWIFRQCFVGNTKVLVAQLPHGSTEVIAGVEDSDEMSIGAACLIIGLGCAVTAYAVGNRIPREPRLRRRKLGHGMIDDLFSTDESNSLFDEYAQDGTARTLIKSQQSAWAPPAAISIAAAAESVGRPVVETVVVASAEEPWITEPPATVLQVEKTAIGENSGPKASNGSLASRSLAVIAALMLTIGGVFTARDYVRTQPQPLLAAVDAAEHQAYQKPQYLSKDIRDLQVMQDRVLADNPLEDETESPLGEIVPSEWRVVRLEHTEPNGTRHIIERGMPLDELTTVTARPSASIGDFEVDESWQPGDPLPEYFDESGFPIDPSVVAAMLAERSAASNDTVAGLPTEPLIVGSTIFVDLPEHGISADFTVSAILPCPTPNPSDGYLVTTKFIHENAEILDLRIEGSADVIGTTSSHPFWSEDRQQFVAAGDLRVGENLRLADDTTRRLESLTRRETRETVYNIEVDGEHVFYVGNDGVLVHNNCVRTATGWRILGQGPKGKQRWLAVRPPGRGWTQAAREAGWKAKGRANGKGWQRDVRVRFKDGTEGFIRERKELHHLDPLHAGGSNHPSNLLEVWPEEHGALDPFRANFLDYEVVEILSDPF